jgi:predicted nucleic acid-binding protein
LSAVVDSSLLVAALLDAGPQGKWAETVIAAGGLAAPELVWVESMNTLRRLEHARRISAPEANAAREDLMQLELQAFPFDPFAERVWQLRHNLTSYDAWYVAVAEALELPLATLDKRLARAGGRVCIFLVPT